MLSRFLISSWWSTRKFHYGYPLEIRIVETRNLQTKILMAITKEFLFNFYKILPTCSIQIFKISTKIFKLYIFNNGRCFVKHFKFGKHGLYPGPGFSKLHIPINKIFEEIESRRLYTLKIQIRTFCANRHKTLSKWYKNAPVFLSNALTTSIKVHIFTFNFYSDLLFYSTFWNISRLDQKASVKAR